MTRARGNNNVVAVGRGRGGGRGATNSGVATRNSQNEASVMRRSMRSVQVGVAVGGQVSGDTNVLIGNQTKCGLCESHVGGDSIGCDHCPSWFHPTTQCTGLKQASIDCILSEGGDAIRFICSKCRCSSRTQSGNLTVGGNDDVTPLSQLYQIVQALTVSVTKLTQQVTTLINQPMNPPLQSESSANLNLISRESLYVEMREFEERKKRSNSIIIKGINAIDEVAFKNVLDEMCEELVGESLVIDDIFCINRDRNMYRVKVQNRERKTALLLNAKNLKNSQNFSRVFISRDLTYLQRQELARKRLASRQANNSNFTPIGPSTDGPSQMQSNLPVPAQVALSSSQPGVQDFQ